MRNEARTCAVIAAISICLLLLISAPVPARSVWPEGRVSKAPWSEKHRHIEVKGEQYTFMPEAIINGHHRNASGSLWKMPYPCRIFARAKWAQIRIQGKGTRIYEITMLE